MFVQMLIGFFGSNMLVSLAVPTSSGFNLFVLYYNRAVMYFTLSLLTQHLTMTSSTLAQLLVRMCYE